MSIYSQTVAHGDRRVVRHIDESACCICGGTRFERWFDLPGTRFGIERCVSCGLGVMVPMLTANEVASFYAAGYYGSDGTKFGLWTEGLVRFVARRRTTFLRRHLPHGGRVLDVGCGRGVVASPLAAAGYDVTGIEILREAVRGIDDRVHVVIADSLHDTSLPKEQFDLVLLWHVLEHLANPVETLAEIHRILRPGGRLVVAVPNFSSWQARWTGPAWFHLDPPRHLFHFPLTALRTLLTRSGFDVQRTHHFSLRQNPFGWLQSLINRLMPKQRNRLYEYLLNEATTVRSMSPVERFGWFTAYCAGMVLMLPLSVFAAVFRSGATVHCVAVKRS